MKRMNPTFYLGSMIAYIPVGGLLLLLSFLIEDNWEHFPPWFVTIGVPLFLFTGIGVLIYGKLIMLAIWYKSWKAIQTPIGDSASRWHYSRTTPGKAVGFMFIPIFNIYWAYQEFWGFAKDFNSYVEHNEMDIRKLPQGLLLSISIGYTVAYIPPLIIFAAGAIFILQLIAFFMMAERVNGVIDLKRGNQKTVEPTL